MSSRDFVDNYLLIQNQLVVDLSAPTCWNTVIKTVTNSLLMSRTYIEKEATVLPKTLITTPNVSNSVIVNLLVFLFFEVTCDNRVLNSHN